MVNADSLGGFGVSEQLNDTIAQSTSALTNCRFTSTSHAGSQKRAHHGLDALLDAHGVSMRFGFIDVGQSRIAVLPRAKSLSAGVNIARMETEGVGAVGIVISRS